MPQFNSISEVNVPKVLENALGLFSTRLIEKNVNTSETQQETQQETASACLSKSQIGKLKKN